MRKTYSAGGVVVNNGKVIVVNQKMRSWSLPKGHIEENENKLEAAKREIQEETGISDLELIKELGTYERPKMDSENKDDKEEMKVMTFFLFKTSQTKLAPNDPDKDIPEARWATPEEAISLLTDPKDKAFFRKIRKEIKV